MIDNGVIVTSHGNTVVEVSGQKDGETQRHVLWSPYPGVREVMKTYPMANQTSYMASTNGVVLALILGRGESKVVGVTMPELLEPEVRQKYLAELAKQDPPIIAYERVEKRIR
jgi:saccharopine dehydrogenase-like NADP-dependent oxidoreductase